MSTTATTSETSLAALSQLVAAAAAVFPADGVVAGPADVQEDPSELLPSDDALVLVAPVEDVPGRRLVAVVSPALLTAMGLPGADALADALAPVFAGLAGGTTPALDAARLGVGSIGLADVDPTGDAALLVAAGLFLGSDHVATLGISVTSETTADHVADHAEASADADRAEGAGVADHVAPMDLPEVAPSRSQSAPDPSTARSLDLLRNVEMNLTAELGRSKMTVAELLSLTPGSVVELNHTAGTPIDVLVNGTLIARGEVVVIDEEFGVRISEIVDRIDGA
jgi:flagellar motor switch protein FliN